MKKKLKEHFGYKCPHCNASVTLIKLRPTVKCIEVGDCKACNIAHEIVYDGKGNFEINANLKLF